jgi:arylsulfatase A-like enzyme
MPSPQNGVRDYFDPLPSGARTIAHELRARGYATAFFGKWHLGTRDRAAPLVGEAHAKTIVPPEARGGFEFWEGFESGFLLNDPWLHGTRLPVPTQFPGYQSDVLCERAATWNREDGDRKQGSWFCLVSLEAPHPPYDATAAGVSVREIELPANVPRGGETEARARRELAGYYAHIEATDQAIGRVLLPAAMRNDTVVVFTSVHGDMHGAHGLFRKGWPHEESVRVPLLVRGRRAEDRGRRDDGNVSLLNLSGLMFAEVENQRPKFENSGAYISMPSVVALPHQCDREWRGVRTKTRKLVLGPEGSTWLFFDLVKDPLETTNLASDPAYAGEISALRAQHGLR